MTRDEAENKILGLLQNEYKGDLNSPMEPLPFYYWLQKNHPDALEFPFAGDQYQDVQAMVARYLKPLSKVEPKGTA